MDSRDLRLTYYCNVTNLTDGCRAKIMYPQGKPLWKMVRASMGLAEIFPPFMMDDHGDLLVDGCYSANVPVFPALTLGAEVVFAFDVSIPDVAPAQHFGPSVSGWRLAMQLLFQSCLGNRRHGSKHESDMDKKIAVGSSKAIVTEKNGWSRSPDEPQGAGIVENGPLTIGKTISLFSFTTNINEIRAIKKTPECLYYRPPVRHIGAFSMDKIDEAQEIGYKSAKQWLREMKAAGKLDHLALSL